MVISFVIAGIQGQAPEALRGRILGIYSIISQVVPAASGVAAGVLVRSTGTASAIAFRVHDAKAAYERALNLGAWGYAGQAGPGELTRIFHRSRATNEDGIALVCPKIQVSNLDQRAGNAEAKLYRRN